MVNAGIDITTDQSIDIAGRLWVRVPAPLADRHAPRVPGALLGRRRGARVGFLGALGALPAALRGRGLR